MKCLRLFQAQKSSSTVAARRWLLYATHAHTVFRDFLAIRRRRRDSWTGQVFKKEVKIEEKNIIAGYSSGLWKFTEKGDFPQGNIAKCNLPCKIVHPELLLGRFLKSFNLEPLEAMKIC